ncbi:MAG TPA: GtrA family protein [Pseudomonadales bacterium]|jgi:putative flippase GtrA
MQHKFFRFLISGGVSTVISYAVYLVANHWLPYGWAWTLAYGAGIIYGYIVQSIWVYKRPMSVKSFFAFPLVYVVQYLVTLALLSVLIGGLGWSEIYSPLLVVVSTIPLTYALSRFVIEKGSSRLMADSPDGVGR